MVDAIHVAALFNMIDRMADSLKFEVPPYESFLGRAGTMLVGGYLLYDLPDPGDVRVEEEAE
jgi:tetrahydromethanopterin S-methyltransferase subunit B